MAEPAKGRAVEIRLVRDSEAEALWRLRYHALHSEPAAFASTPEEHAQRTVSQIAEQLCGDAADSFVVGAFSGAELIGMTGFYRDPKTKRRHIGHIWGVFVSSDYRGLGIGRELLSAAIARAGAIEGLTAVQLSVSGTQPAARRLYESLGFQVWGVEPKALSVDGRLIDELYMVLTLGG